MTTAEPATEVRAIPTYIAIPASKVLGEVVLVVPVEGVAVPADRVYMTVAFSGVNALFTSIPLTFSTVLTSPATGA